MFPAGLVDETLETLALLFPENDRKNQKWLNKFVQTYAESTLIDNGLSKAGHFRSDNPSRKLLHYHFWRDRLAALHDAVDIATPPSEALKKTLRDRKKGDTWLNSWAAVVAIGMALFFGLVQSIEGAIQVYKAYH
jgi:hypothetical protein